eukprot:SAG11_NODE_1477_length_4837_cov_2.462431_8_plen_107_part_00
MADAGLVLVLLKEQCIEVSSEQFEAMWAIVDKDRNGSIDKDEFVALWLLTKGTYFHTLPDLNDEGNQILDSHATFTERWQADAEFRAADKFHTGRLTRKQVNNGTQ